LFAPPGSRSIEDLGYTSVWQKTSGIMGGQQRCSTPSFLSCLISWAERNWSSLSHPPWILFATTRVLRQNRCWLGSGRVGKRRKSNFQLQHNTTITTRKISNMHGHNSVRYVKMSRSHALRQNLPWQRIGLTRSHFQV
jgi:hypothetical protein